MLCPRATFYLHLILVVLGLAADDDTSPVTGLSASGTLFRCEYDRSRCRALCDELSSSFHDERCLCLLVTLDDGAWLYCQLSSVSYVYPSFQQVGAFFQCLLACEYELSVAITNLVAVGILAVVHFREEQMVACFQTTVGAPYVFLLVVSAVSVVVIVTTA